MKTLNKLLMTLSLIFEIICLVACIWMSTVLKDGLSYLMVFIFAAAVIITGITLYKSTRR